MSDNTTEPAPTPVSPPSEEEVQKILDQAPEWATSVQVYELWQEFEGDVVAILSKLWDVPAPKEKPKTKWDNFREICDEYDKAMEEYLHQNRQ